MWVWWLAGRTFPRPRRPSQDGRGEQAAIRRHPAGRERWPEPDSLRAQGQPGGALRRPTGPDDDPEFISALERLIRGEDPGGLA
jgi:transposase